MCDVVLISKFDGGQLSIRETITNEKKCPVGRTSWTNGYSKSSGVFLVRLLLKPIWAFISSIFGVFTFIHFIYFLTQPIIIE